IGVLVDVLLQIEQQQRRADLGPDCLPLARADGLLETPFAELPVEEVMLLLVSLAQESGQEGDAVEGGGRPGAGDVGERGQDVPEGADVVAGRARGNRAGPADDEGYANAAVVHRAFEAAQR